MAKGIVISPDKCTGCRTCELACSYTKTDSFNPKDSAISVLSYDEAGLQVPMTCLQCEEPHCMMVCTVNAISKDSKSGVVQVDGDKCIGCKMCEKNCEFDAIHVVDNLAKVDYDKCTQCMVCVEKCPVSVIQGKEA